MTKTNSTPKICKVDGCDSDLRTRGGYCSKHYQRLRKHGDPLKALTGNGPTTCTIDGCDTGGQLKRGWCQKHYERWRKYGDPLKVLRVVGNDKARFESYQLRGTKPTDCWMWLSHRNKKGYGLIRIAGKTVGAHRHAYELAYGPIPEGLQVRHSCHQPQCTNPLHLSIGTAQDNSDDCTIAERQSRGSGHARAVLRDEHISAIRILCRDADEYRAEHGTAKAAAAGASYSAIGRAFGVDSATIRQVATSKTWTHIPTAIPELLNAAEAAELNEIEHAC